MDRWHLRVIWPRDFCVGRYDLRYKLIREAGRESSIGSGDLQ